MQAKSKLRWALAAVLFLLWVGQSAQMVRQTNWGWQVLVNEWSKPVSWRSVRFFANEKTANFVDFVRSVTPEDASVVVPPSYTDTFVGNMTLMRWALFPRGVRNCTDDACLAQEIRRGQADVLIAHESVPEDIASSRRVSMWEDGLGVIHAVDETVTVPSRSALSGEYWLGALLAEAVLLGAMLLLGTGIVFLWNKSFFEDTNFLLSWLVVAGGLGAGALTFGVYLLSLAGVSVRAAGWIVGLLGWAWGGSVLWQQRSALAALWRAKSWKRWRRKYWGLALLTAWVGVLAVFAMGKGYYSSDALGFWAIKGYGLAKIGIRGARWGWIRDYPLHVPFLIALPQALWGDIAGVSKLVFPAFLWGAAVLFYESAYSRTSRAFWAFLGGAFLVTSPLFAQHATIAYANLPLAFYVFLGVWLLYEKRTAWLAGWAFAWGVWTRPDGWIAVAVVLLMGIVYLFKKRQWGAVVPPLIVTAIWVVSKTYDVYAGPAYRVGGVTRSFLPGAIALAGGDIRWREGLYLLGEMRRFLRPSLWGLLGWLMIVLGASAWRTWRENADLRNIALAGVGLIAFVVGMYYFVSYQGNLAWWVETGFDRMMMPAVLLLWYAAWNAFLERWIKIK